MKPLVDLIATVTTLAGLPLALAQGPCCLPQAGPGCGDADCAEVVCAIDPPCCAVQWDHRCSVQAGVLCDACRPTAPCQPPAAVHSEREACDLDLGGGCELAPGSLQPLAWSIPLEGTIWAHDTARDVDWYRLDVETPSRVRIECWSDGPAGVALVDARCPPVVHGEAPDGCPALVESCLPAGTYRVVVRSLLFEPLACGGTGTSYVLRATTTPCEPSPPANDRLESATPIGAGLWAYDATEAGTDPNPLPAWCDEGGGLGISHDVWFSFESDRATTWLVGTCGTLAIDTRLAVYRAASLEPLACDDDGCGDGGSELSIPLGIGEKILVRVGSWGHGGAGQLRVRPAGSGDTLCPGDLDAEGSVDSADIGILLIAFGTAVPTADLDGSGVVDSGDLGLLLLRMGPCST